MYDAMRLKERISAALQTFREAPDLRSRLDTLEHELKCSEQEFEQMERACTDLLCTLDERDSRIRFLNARSDALSSALKEFAPRLSTTEDMKRFYDTVACDLDPDGHTLYRVAKQLTGADVTGLFPYEDARGMFEFASGHTLMSYLTAACFDAVEWETIPGSTYESAALGDVDTASPEYRQFERQLYENVLERMGFDELLVPRQAEPALELAQLAAARSDNMMEVSQ